jgi:hypothetical protein
MAAHAGERLDGALDRGECLMVHDRKAFSECSTMLLAQPVDVPEKAPGGPRDR